MLYCYTTFVYVGIKNKCFVKNVYFVCVEEQILILFFIIILLIVMPGGGIQITTNPDGQTSVSPGLQTFTMSNASPTTSSTTQGATIVQYAQGPDGQFYIPGELSNILYGRDSKGL
jgi:hypothetical protein